MRRAIVDVDGILWDLHTRLIPLMHTLYPKMPNELPSEWNWFLEYMTLEQFAAITRMVHSEQIHHPAYPGAAELIKLLDKQNYEIFIASQRDSNTANLLAKWLQKNYLTPYSMVYTGNSKKDFLEPGCLLIDDAPATIKYALTLGCDVHYLDWPWNQGLGGNRWSDLYQLLGAISDGRD